MATENPRKYGSSPYSVVLVHGGPGAPGEMAPVAKKLSERFGILEPLQTQNSVKSQVQELAAQIREYGNFPVVLVGWSWGAWLSFIVAAQYPDLVKKLILVSSGPFDAVYAKRIMPTRLSHLNYEDSQRAKFLLSKFQKGVVDNLLFSEFGELMSKADSFDLIHTERVEVKAQADIYESVWKEADKLRKSGELLEYGKLITCPVVVIHGDYDPHPFEGVKEPLVKIIKESKFFLLKNCGHHPWFEKQAKDKFYEVITKESYPGK